MAWHGMADRNGAGAVERCSRKDGNKKLSTKQLIFFSTPRRTSLKYTTQLLCMLADVGKNFHSYVKILETYAFWEHFQFYHLTIGYLTKVN